MFKLAILSWIAFGLSLLSIRLMAISAGPFQVAAWKCTNRYPTRIIMACLLMAALFIISVVFSILFIIFL